MDQFWGKLAPWRYQGRIVSVQRLRDLQEEIETHCREGRLNDEFYRERLAWFHFSPPEALPDARSIIIVAVPRPQTEAIFNWRGKSLSLILPPTYTDYRKIAQQVANLLTGALQSSGYSVAASELPLKLLAVRSGLGAYGRNNICYVPGMGSFLELVGLYSDIPCPEDHWKEARMMETCQSCRACLQHCPASAISEDRFLLRAERCIVFHNERPSSIPFPSWIDPSWHNCLEGCMHCQRVCPENRNFWGWIEGREEFSEEETSLLLKGDPQDCLPKETIDKLERLDILGDLELFPRNLGVFLRA
jgi:epoxyqueuosine reductase